MRKNEYVVNANHVPTRLGKCVCKYVELKCLRLVRSESILQCCHSTNTYRKGCSLNKYHSTRYSTILSIQSQVTRQAKVLDSSRFITLKKWLLEQPSTFGGPLITTQYITSYYVVPTEVNPHARILQYYQVYFPNRTTYQSGGDGEVLCIVDLPYEFYDIILCTCLDTLGTYICVSGLSVWTLEAEANVTQSVLVERYPAYLLLANASLSSRQLPRYLGRQYIKIQSLHQISGFMIR